MEDFVTLSTGGHVSIEFFSQVQETTKSGGVCNRCPMSDVDVDVNVDVRCPMSMSDVRCPMSMVSDVQCPMSMSDVRCPMSMVSDVDGADGYRSIVVSR